MSLNALGVAAFRERGWEEKKTYLKQLKPEKYLCECVCVCVCVKFSCQVQEIFGPVLVVYVYPEKEWESTLHLIDDTSP